MSELTAKQAKKKEQNDYYYARLAAARDTALGLSDRMEKLETQQALLIELLAKALGAPGKQRAA